jgi:hypothetical protein
MHHPYPLGSGRCDHRRPAVDGTRPGAVAWAGMSDIGGLVPHEQIDRTQVPGDREGDR